MATPPSDVTFSLLTCIALGLAGLTSCASARSETDAGSAAGIDARPTADARRFDAGPPDAGAIVASMCPSGEFATGLGSDGRVICAAITDAARAAVNNNCSVYLGWRDGCDGCTSSPAKWGRTDAVNCSNGTGTDNTCTAPSLAGTVVNLFGLNTDGGVDENDKFYFGFRCEAPADTPAAGPCPAGSFVSAITADGVECVTGHAAIIGYVSTGCELYAAWSDNCDGCVTTPEKWGRVNTDACVIGTGVNNTCTLPPLGGPSVRMLGINTDGEVNDDDKFYVGFQCNGAMASGGPVAGTCPTGQLVVGVNDDGTVECASPAPATETAVRNDCSVYLAWHDSCDGCVTAPQKWGMVSHASCQNGIGAANTCTTPTLGGAAVPLFGLNTDGDVNDDDKFYVGLNCQ